MSIDERLTEYDTLINDFVECRKSKDIERLCRLIEHVRGEGILYQDFPEKNAALLQLLLTISLDFISSLLIFTSDTSWWFIMEVYDIIFHQVRLKDYSSVFAELYFKLSKEVLDEKFHKLYERDSTMSFYGMCVYFIQLADGWFADREEEFVVLYQKMKPLFGEAPNHLEKPWLNRYRELNINKD